MKDEKAVGISPLWGTKLSKTIGQWLEQSSEADLSLQLAWGETAEDETEAAGRMSVTHAS